MFSINVSGYIPQQKSREFKQHMKQLIGLQNAETVKLIVSQDLMVEDLIHVKVAFYDQESMNSFLRSEDYAMILGSIKTLGLLKESKITSCSDIENENRSSD